MARIRLDTSGFRIALPGRDVDEGEQYQIFSPTAAAMPIWMRGTIAMGSTGYDTGAPDFYNNRYRRRVVELGRTFSAPPIVFVVGTWNYTTSRMLPTRASFGADVVSGTPLARFEPLFGEVTTTQLILWHVFANITHISYLVLENTLT